MPNRSALLLSLGFALLAGPTADAGVHPDVSIIIHLVPVDGFPRRACDSVPPASPTDVVTAGDLDQMYLAYVLVAGSDTSQGVSGVQFGIAYDDSMNSGIVIEHWQRCSLYEWHLEDWPLSNTGNLLTWAQRQDCQQTDPVVVGFFYLRAQSPDRLRIVPRPADNLASVAACGINQINLNDRVDNLVPDQLGWVDFGGGEGYNPWDPEQNVANIQRRFKPIKN